MLREIVLDTETTGLDPKDGHRIVEIGAVELIDHLPSGATFHRYVNPERDMPQEAERIHGLTGAFLARHPVFAEIVEEFLDFIADSPLVIHNASFDLRFLNAELRRCGRDPLPPARAIDTLLLAQRKFPGQSNSLDALCRRFGVDAAHRKLHGALLDSELLAEVYLHLIGGRQAALGLETGRRETAAKRGPPRRRRAPRPHAPTAEERTAHEAFLATLENPLWLEAAATADRFGKESGGR